MVFEVEQKFRVDRLDEIRCACETRGAMFAEPIGQVDCYFRHPARDFGQTDEAFRLRQVGERNWITYKGPKIDSTTKTRRELELPLPDGVETFNRFRELLVALGFTPVGEVRKRRRYAQMNWLGAPLTVVLDQVEGLPPHVEIETMSEEHELDAARDRIASLARELGLGSSERRSYLELLLNSRMEAES